MVIGNGLSISNVIYICLTVWGASLANVSMAFASYGSAGGSQTMLTVASLQITTFWLPITSLAFILYH